MFIFWIIGCATTDMWSSITQKSIWQIMLGHNYNYIYITLHYVGRHLLGHNYRSGTISILNFLTELLRGSNNHFVFLIQIIHKNSLYLRWMFFRVLGISGCCEDANYTADIFTSKQHGPIKILDFVIFAECWRFVSGDPNENIWVLIIGKSCTDVLQRCGRNWAIFRMDQFESSGDWDEYVLMNMWRSPNVPTSHLSNCPAATLPLVNFALFFLFLTKHYIYMFSSSSIYICTVQNVPQHAVWYGALIVYIKSWAQILLVRATGPKSMWGPNNAKLWARIMLGAFDQNKVNLDTRQWPTF